MLHGVQFQQGDEGAGRLDPVELLQEARDQQGHGGENCQGRPAGRHLTAPEDAEFSSPSAAVSIVHGGHANGLIAWKNGTGKTLKEIEAEAEHWSSSGGA